MIIKQLVDEDFVNYKKPSMFIIFPKCTFKCNKDCGRPVCQNYKVLEEPSIEVSIGTIVNRYLNNLITSAIVLGGLEPFDSEEELKELIFSFREKTQDPIVIYTGYKEEELSKNETYKEIISLNNIIIKYGRFIPDQDNHRDNILGVKLASSNQYAKAYNFKEELL